MNKQKKQGHLIIISAASGTGKTSLIKQCLAQIENLQFSISCTSRQKRSNEEDKKDYFFLTEQEFKHKIEQNEFLEWAKVYTNYYGTLKSQSLEWLNKGQDLIVDIDVQGAKQIIGNFNYPYIKSIFILPPSIGELEKRIHSRSQNKSDDIKIRLDTAKKEIQQAKIYDFLLINNSFELALNQLMCIINSLNFNRDFYLTNNPSTIKSLVAGNSKQTI